MDGDGVELEGAYTLDVTFSPEAGSEGCAGHLTCNAGACECADPTLTDCGSVCADTQTDDAHCGGCSSPCVGDAHCVNGSCVSAPAEDAGAGGDAGDATELPCCDDCSDKGCGCRAVAADGGFPLVVLLVLLLAGLVRRRRAGCDY